MSLWLSFMIIIVIYYHHYYYYYVKKSIAESITQFKENKDNIKYANWQFENIPKKRLLEISDEQWGLFLSWEMGNYIGTKRIKPIKTRGNKYMVDREVDMVDNFPVKQLFGQLKTMKLLQKYGKKKPSEIMQLNAARTDEEANGFLDIFNDWCLQFLFQNKTHYCLFWILNESTANFYGV